MSRKEKIIKLVASGNIDDAITLIAMEENTNESILIQSRFYSNKRAYRVENIISYKEFVREDNKIKLAILALIENFKFKEDEDSLIQEDNNYKEFNKNTANLFEYLSYLYINKRLDFFPCIYKKELINLNIQAVNTLNIEPKIAEILFRRTMKDRNSYSELAKLLEEYSAKDIRLLDEFKLKHSKYKTIIDQNNDEIARANNFEMIENIEEPNQKMLTQKIEELLDIGNNQDVLNIYFNNSSLRDDPDASFYTILALHQLENFGLRDDIIEKFIKAFPLDTRIELFQHF